MSGMKRMSPKEFQDAGLLQEVNRRLLHPIGLALEVVEDDNGDVRFGQVQDHRDADGGVVFIEVDPEAVRAFDLAWRDATKVREFLLGYVIQPEGVAVVTRPVSVPLNELPEWLQFLWEVNPAMARKAEIYWTATQ